MKFLSFFHRAFHPSLIRWPSAKVCFVIWLKTSRFRQDKDFFSNVYQKVSRKRYYLWFLTHNEGPVKLVVVVSEMFWSVLNESVNYLGCTQVSMNDNVISLLEIWHCPGGWAYKKLDLTRNLNQRSSVSQINAVASGEWDMAQEKITR